MIRAALYKIGNALVQLGSAAPAPTPRPPERQRSADDRLRQRLAERTDGPASLLAGSVQLLGLGELQAAVGPHWSTVADRALRIAEEVIAAQLDSHDEYQCRDDTFILVFAELDRAAAERRTRDIGARIKARFAAEIADANLGIAHRVAEVDCAAALAAGTPIVDMVARTLSDIGTEVRSTLERLRRELLHDARVVYGPIWSPPKRAVLMYRCLLDQATGATTLRHMQDLSSAQELQAALFDIDCFILGQAVVQVHALIQRQARAMFLVPLHFQTLREKAHRDAYIELCKTIPSAYRSFLLFEIHGIPNDLLVARVLDLVDCIRPHGQGVVLQWPASQQHLAQIAQHAVFGISVDLSGMADAPDRSPAWLAELAQAAAQRRLPIFAHGANSLGLAEACIKAGMDYIDGQAIASRLETPRGIYRLTDPLMSGSAA